MECIASTGGEHGKEGKCFLAKLMACKYLKKCDHVIFAYEIEHSEVIIDE